MNRRLTALASLSGAYVAALTAAWIFSYWAPYTSPQPGVALARRFHVGVSNGFLYAYRDLLFFGGTTSIARDNEPPRPRTRERAVSFPGADYVSLSTAGRSTWNFRLHLLYPILLSLPFPLLWLFRSPER